MARSYAPELRLRVVQRVRSGHSVKKVAAEVGAAEATVVARLPLTQSY